MLSSLRALSVKSLGKRFLDYTSSITEEDINRNICKWIRKIPLEHKLIVSITTKDNKHEKIVDRYTGMLALYDIKTKKSFTDHKSWINILYDHPVSYRGNGNITIPAVPTVPESLHTVHDYIHYIYQHKVDRVYKSIYYKIDQDIKDNSLDIQDPLYITTYWEADLLEEIQRLLLIREGIHTVIDNREPLSCKLLLQS